MAGRVIRDDIALLAELDRDFCEAWNFDDFCKGASSKYRSGPKTEKGIYMIYSGSMAIYIGRTEAENGFAQRCPAHRKSSSVKPWIDAAEDDVVIGVFFQRKLRFPERIHDYELALIREYQPLANLAGSGEFHLAQQARYHARHSYTA